MAREEINGGLLRDNDDLVYQFVTTVQSEDVLVLRDAMMPVKV